MRKRTGGALGAAGALAAASLVVLAAGPAAATTISVANESQYRNALTALSADPSGPHTMDVTADITLSDGTDPTYTGTQPLTLAGNGHTIDAGGTSRVLDQSTSAALTVRDLTVTGGRANGGGGISADGSATFVNSAVTGNTATGAGGTGGGILALSVTLTNSMVTGNTAEMEEGGGIDAVTAVTLTNATVSDNTTNADGGGIGTQNGPVTLTNSTVSGNTAVGANGGGGGGIFTGGAATLTNSTVSGNTALAAVGGGGILADGTTTLVYASVVDNSAPAGANILFATEATLEPFGSVIALPHGGGANCDVGATTSNGSNFSDDTSCALTGAGDRQDADNPDLGALANNGGPTSTRLPQPGSSLIDAIPVANCQADGASGITTDQRGIARPQDAGCDIGAVEVEVAAPSPTPSVPAVVVVAPRFTG